jgi:hypothetical protein
MAAIYQHGIKEWTARTVAAAELWKTILMESISGSWLKSGQSKFKIQRNSLARNPEVC